MPYPRTWLGAVYTEDSVETKHRRTVPIPIRIENHINVRNTGRESTTKPRFNHHQVTINNTGNTHYCGEPVEVTITETKRVITTITKTFTTTIGGTPAVITKTITSTYTTTITKRTTVRSPLAPPHPPAKELSLEPTPIIIAVAGIVGAIIGSRKMRK